MILENSMKRVLLLTVLLWFSLCVFGQSSNEWNLKFYDDVGNPYKATDKVETYDEPYIVLSSSAILAVPQKVNSKLFIVCTNRQMAIFIPFYKNLNHFLKLNSPDRIYSALHNKKAVTKFLINDSLGETLGTWKLENMDYSYNIPALRFSPSTNKTAMSLIEQLKDADTLTIQASFSFGTMTTFSVKDLSKHIDTLKSYCSPSTDLEYDIDLPTLLRNFFDSGNGKSNEVFGWFYDNGTVLPPE